MKTIIYSTLLLFLSFGTLTACKKETSRSTTSNSNQNTLEGRWYLMRIYGGIAGINDVYSTGEIKWSFNTQNGTLTVNNTVGNSTNYYLPSGTYPFHQITGPTENYLVIDADELGQITFSGNQLLIDSNKKSTGEGACGFYLTLQR